MVVCAGSGRRLQAVLLCGGLMAGWIVPTATASAAAATGSGTSESDPVVTVFSLHDRLESPTAVAVTPTAGWIVGANDTIARVDPATRAMLVEPLPGIDQPSDLLVGPDGDLWITAQDSDGLGRYDPDTGQLTVHPTPGVDGPTRLTLGPDGNIWFTGIDNDSVGRFDPDTDHLDAFPLAGVDRPWGVAAGPDGNIWVTGSGNDTVAAVVPATGAVAEVVATTGLDEPRGVIGVDDGTVWVAGFGNDTVGRVVTASGAFNGFPFPVTGNAEGPIELIHGPGDDLLVLSGSTSRLATLDPDTGAVGPFFEATQAWTDFALAANGDIWAVGTAGSLHHLAVYDGSGVRRYSTRGVVAPGQLAVGADGNLWIGGHGLGRVDPADGEQLPVIPVADDTLGDDLGERKLTLAPDGRVWFTSGRGAGHAQLYAVTTGGVVTVEDTMGSQQGDVAVGPDGWIWTRDASSLHYSPLTGPLDLELAGVPGSAASAMALGPDGNLWVTSPPTDEVSRVDVGTDPPTVDVFPTTGIDSPDGIVPGPSGDDLWIRGANDRVGRVDPTTGALTATYDVPGVDIGDNVQPGFPGGIVAGPDGNIWVTGSLNDTVGRVDPSTGAASSHALAGVDAPRDIAVGPDGNLWVTGADNGTLARLAIEVGHVAVELSADPAQAAPGDTIELEAVITNTGDVPLTGLAVSESTTSDCVGPVGDGVLAAGAEVTVTCEAVASGADVGGRSDTVTVDTGQTPPVTSDPVAVAVAIPRHHFPDVDADDYWDAAASWAAFYGIVNARQDGSFGGDLGLQRKHAASWAFAMFDRPPGSPRFPWVDVPRGAPYRPALKWATAQDLVTGYPGDRFKPARVMNRAQFVWLLWNALDRPDAGGHEHPFTDVPDGAWFADALDWADSAGLASFPGGGSSFGPKEPVTRAEAVTALFRVAGEPGLWTALDGDPPSTVLF